MSQRRQFRLFGNLDESLPSLPVRATHIGGTKLSAPQHGFRMGASREVHMARGTTHMRKAPDSTPKPAITTAFCNRCGGQTDHDIMYAHKQETIRICRLLINLLFDLRF